MRKLTLEIYLPAAQCTFDVQVPPDSRMSQVTELAARAIENISRDWYDAESCPLLCDRESGNIYNINMTVWELGLRNGSKLMLI